MLEEYLRDHSEGLTYSILGPSVLFENFDDSVNNNPLKKGNVKFLSEKNLKFCSSYDVGRAAAIMFKNTREWAGKRLDVVSWEGNLAQVATALEKVSGVKVKYSTTMPFDWMRRRFLNDLQRMFFLMMECGTSPSSINAFKKIVPDAFSCEDWFRFHNKYANGESIVGNTTPVKPGVSKMPILSVVALLSGVAAALSSWYYMTTMQMNK